MALGRADRGDDALAHSGEHGLFAGAADELFDVGTHGHSGLGDELDTVLSHCRYGRGVDNLGVDRHLHGFEHVAAGEVDGGCHLEVEGDIRLVGRNEGHYHLGDIALSEIVGLELVGLEGQAGLRSGNKGHHDSIGIDAPPAHEHEMDEADPDARQDCLEPERYGEEPEKDDEGDYDDRTPDDDLGHMRVILWVLQILRCLRLP